LGINPKVPPVELMSADFMKQLAAHAGKSGEAKASEMEHAIRKHCTVHHDEDPAFYRSLSEKVDALIEKHQEDWDTLVERLAELREEALAGRRTGGNGMSREASALHDHILQAAFPEGTLGAEDLEKFRGLMASVVDVLQESIGSIDFWQDPDKQKRLRGKIKNEIAKTGIAPLQENRERVALEILKLARNRHDALLNADPEGDA
jgi:type I restriction enzyme R subunit